MSAPIKVTDLVSKSLDELNKAGTATAGDAQRFERNARVFADLAGVQSAKTANIIAYLNSDRSTWSDTDEEVVRVMLGLHSLGGEDGGTDTAAPDVSAPSAPEPDAQPERTAIEEPADVTSEPDAEEPVFVPREIEEPTFA